MQKCVVGPVYHPHAQRKPTNKVNENSVDDGVFFIFTFFKKKLQKYILVFKIYSSIPLPPGRGAAGGLPPPCWAVGTSLQIKNKIYLRINPWWGPAAPLSGGRPPTAKWWGGRYLHLGYASENFLVEYTCKE